MQEKQKQKFLDEDIIKENSKIYGRGTQKPITAWQNAVNEAAHEIVQNNHNLLYDRASLKFQAEARARETYIFKKRSGSRSKLTQNDSEQQVKRTKLNHSQRVTLLSSLSEQLVSVKKQIEITEKHISRSTAISDFDSCSKAHVQLRKLLAEKQSLQNKLIDIESKNARAQKRNKSKQSQFNIKTPVSGTENITTYFSVSNTVENVGTEVNIFQQANTSATSNVSIPGKSPTTKKTRELIKVDDDTGNIEVQPTLEVEQDEDENVVKGAQCDSDEVKEDGKEPVIDMEIHPVADMMQSSNGENVTNVEYNVESESYIEKHSHTVVDVSPSRKKIGGEGCLTVKKQKMKKSSLLILK